MNAPIGVTGATGHLGGAVARLLSDHQIPARLIVRDPARAPQLPGTQLAQASYDDGQSMLGALDGIHTLLLVSGSEAPDRLEQHRTAVRAATAAGVERVVYTSFLGASADAAFHLARDHFHTEQALERSGMAYVALRNSLYADVLPFFATDGVIAGPAGDGKLAPAARADIVEVALAALLDPDWDDPRTLDVTGPRALSLDEVAAELTEMTGGPVRYQRQTLDEARASRAQPDIPEWMIEAWISTYTAIAVGEMEVVSDTVERVTGHPATALREHLREPRLLPSARISHLGAP